MKVTITYHRLRAHLEAPKSKDLNDRIKGYHGTRWEDPYWSVPLHHIEALATELTWAGYDVVVQRGQRAG
jgi:hypothetical protein